jgi:hypothetical protein
MCDARWQVEASGFEVKSGSECEKEGVEERDWNFVAVSGQSYDRPSKTLVHSDEASSRTGWLARLVFELDARLRRRLGLIEYTSDPDCIFRIELRRLDHPITLSDGTELLPGEEIVQLHFWNERIPRYDGAGANFQWARQFSRLLGHSLRELSSFLSRHDLKAVRGVRADVALGTSEHMDQVLRFCDHFGFRPLRNTMPVTARSLLHRFGENILIGLLILAHNRRAFRLDCLRRSRADVFLPRAKLDERFGHGGAPTR